MLIHDKNIEQYILDHTSEEDDVLKELVRATNLNTVAARMLSGHLQGRILQMISSMISPKRVLEIGTFTGYSAICLARGMSSGGVLHTIDINDELEAIAKKYIEKSGVADKIVCHFGSALTVAPEIGGVFDLVFIDGNKREYLDYYQMLFEHSLVESGSFILSDNVLWDGKVVEEIKSSDLQTKSIIEFNDFVNKDPRVENVILPFRDGLSIVKVL